MKQRALRILWPAFLIAGVLEMLVFAVVDPRELRWFGGPLIGWPPLTIYSVTFLMFWGAVATAGALTALLALTADEVNALDSEPEDAPTNAVES
ncbi:MAG TPA: hypothetical protein VF319_14650 [Caldimonas sp.]